MSDLIQVTDLANALAAGGRPATAAQLPLLQSACDTASATAVTICNGRDFVRQTYTESYEPTQDDKVFLRQMPVNGISRISASKSPAITILCTAAVARASVAFTMGTLAVDPPVGITLLSVAAGRTTPTPITFAGLPDPSISSLGTAINAVSGWRATVQDWALGYPCSDLVGGQVAAPAMGSGNFSSNGADIAAYATDVPGRLDRRTGILDLPGVQLAGAEQFSDPSWWPEVGGVSSDKIYRGRVQVTYDAGFDTTPANVVAGTVMIAIALLDRWTADFTLMSEDLGNTSYGRVSPDLIGAVPKVASDFLTPFRIGRV